MKLRSKTCATHIFIHITLAATMLYAAWSIASCSRRHTDTGHSQLVADSVIKAQYDTIFLNPDHAFSRLTEAQSRLSGDSIQFFRIELYKSLSRVVVGDWPMADSLQREVWNFCERTPDSEQTHNLRALFWNHNAVTILNCFGNRDSAIACFNNAYQELLLAGDNVRNEQISVCINLADAYRHCGDASNASRYYRRALAIADSLHNTIENMSIYCGLGQVYAEISNFREANTYFDRAKAIAESDTTGSVEIYSLYHLFVSRGNNLYFQKRYKDALTEFRKAQAIARTLESRDVNFIVDVNIGEVLMLMGSTDSAAIYLERAKETYKLMPNDASKSFYLYSLLGDLELNRNNLPAASRYLALASADSAYAGPRYLALHYERMQHYYSLRHDYRMAYHCQNRARHYLDSINNSAVRNQIAEIDMRYVQDTTMLHTNLIISQKDDHMKRLQIQIYILLIVVIVVVAATIIYNLRRRRMGIEEEMKLQSLIVSQRLANIRNRISPHFIFNVLNRELAASNEGINNLVKLLRRNLELCDRYTVSLAEELDFVDTYIDNERPALGQGFSFEKIIDPAIDPAKVTVTAMMVQIFAENAVKHGLRAISGNKTLRISVSALPTATSITIENNGPAKPADNLGDNTGTGMRVITQTIQLLNDRNRSKIALNIDCRNCPESPQQQWWVVSIVIPHDFNFRPLSSKKRSR